jgi:hypothetical protein
MDVFEPHGCIHTAIGDLYIFGLSARNQMELYKEVDKLLNTCNPADFIRKLARRILKQSLKDGKYKPLTDADISSLTESDLEAFAKLFIEHNEYLFKESLWKSKRDNKGVIIHYMEYGEIQYPQHENESYAQYLIRLFIKGKEDQGKNIKRMLEGFSSFSDELGDSIRNTLSWGDDLKKTMESIRSPEFVSIKQIEPKLPNIDWSEIQEARSRPFNELAERLDKLIDISTQSTEFMIKMNETQTKIAGEIKSSSDQATIFSKGVIWLTIIVIILTLINLAIFSYSVIKSNSDGENQRLEIQEHVNVLAEKLTDINKSIKTANDVAMEQINRQYNTTMESTRKDNENLKSQIMEQIKIIHEMKDAMQRQEKKLEELGKTVDSNHF